MDQKTIDNKFDISKFVFGNKMDVYNEQHMIGYMIHSMIGSCWKTLYTGDTDYTFRSSFVAFAHREYQMKYFKYCLEHFKYDYNIEPYIYNKDKILDSYVSHKEETYERFTKVVNDNLNKNYDEHYLRGYLNSVFINDSYIKDGHIIIEGLSHFDKVYNQILIALKTFNLNYTVKEIDVGFEHWTYYIKLDKKIMED